MLSRKPSCSFFSKSGIPRQQIWSLFFLFLLFFIFIFASLNWSHAWCYLLYLQRVRGLGAWGAENKKKSHKKITKNEETRKKDRCGRWIRTRVGLNHHRKLVKAIMALCEAPRDNWSCVFCVCPSSTPWHQHSSAGHLAAALPGLWALRLSPTWDDSNHSAPGAWQQ